MRSMDCYFHANVPSVAPCAECGKPICATCRDERGTCPSCRLAEKIDAATGVRQSLHGQVPPRPNVPPPPPPQAPPQPRATATVAPVSDDPVESRALVALGYPLWPLALLSLFDRKQSKYLKRQAYQAIGFNLGFAGFWGILQLLTNVPWLGVSADVMIPFLIPIFLIASVYYGIKVWHGDEVRVPILSSWLDERLPLEH
jgi:uncharacterized membrane protein